MEKKGSKKVGKSGSGKDKPPKEEIKEQSF